jgi:hypothetical protein
MSKADGHEGFFAFSNLMLRIIVPFADLLRDFWDTVTYKEEF